MIVKPIIPIWLMIILCIAMLVLIFVKPTKVKKYKIINICTKVTIVILLFLINLRFMIPNGDATLITSDLKVLFVVDTTVSMRALDYNGEEERIKGVINDCCYIIDELAGSRFSIIKFGDEAKRIIPFTNDSDMAQNEIKALRLENDFYANGSSMNLSKDLLEETLENEINNHNDSNIVLFFISDGEITKENEKLESFSKMAKYIDNGAVLGYGTKEGAQMLSSSSSDSDNETKYVTYYEGYKRITGISKIDEKNLKHLASDLDIDYIQMSKTSNIDYKLREIKKNLASSQNKEGKVKSYNDIYYYFAIPLVILLIFNFIIQKRRI